MADADKPNPDGPPDPETDTALLDVVAATEPDATPAVVLDEPGPPDLPQDMPLPPPITPAPPVVTRPARSGGFIPAVFGGLLAAAGGFAASHYDLLQLQTPVDTSAIEASLAGQAQETAALKAELAALAAQPAPDAGLADRLAALEQSVAAADTGALATALSALEARLAAIEAMPSDGTGASAAALVALQAEVAALKGSGAALGQDIGKLAADAEARLAEAEEQAAAMKAEAQEIARKATAAAAIGRVQAALESGGPYAAALVDLGPVDIPMVLRESATTGLPTLASLADAFPAAARAALDASLRANMGESWSERVATFLRNQSGARSLTPREGTDPDAVLSRAEAALVAGDLATALTELQGLPEVGRTAMADWLALADAHLAAQAALTTLAATVGQ
ncbi:MAG: hypothetical protein V4712_05635 [Pseudomonadota bacterium]